MSKSAHVAVSTPTAPMPIPRADWVFETPKGKNLIDAFEAAAPDQDFDQTDEDTDEDHDDTASEADSVDTMHTCEWSDGQCLACANEALNMLLADEDAEDFAEFIECFERETPPASANPRRIEPTALGTESNPILID